MKEFLEVAYDGSGLIEVFARFDTKNGDRITRSHNEFGEIVKTDTHYAFKRHELTKDKRLALGVDGNAYCRICEALESSVELCTFNYYPHWVTLFYSN